MCSAVEKLKRPGCVDNLLPWLNSASAGEGEEFINNINKVTIAAF
jgi:hypothetical protein